MDKMKKRGISYKAMCNNTSIFDFPASSCGEENEEISEEDEEE